MAAEPRLYRAVLDKMLLLIGSGEYPAGGRLPPERELAERFGVSRPTIREAVIALEALGKVHVKTGSGIYVLEQHPDLDKDIEQISPFELTEARAIVEGEAAAIAAKLITDEELLDLKSSLREMAEENDLGDLASGDADRRFHQIIARATRNTMLMSLIERMWFVRNNAPKVFHAYQSICEKDGARRVEEHQVIYAALLNHDPAGARTAMHEHFSRILNKLISTMESEQVEEARRSADEVRRRFSLGRLAASG